MTTNEVKMKKRWTIDVKDNVKVAERSRGSNAVCMATKIKRCKDLRLISDEWNLYLCVCVFVCVGVCTHMCEYVYIYNILVIINIVSL